MPLLILRLFLFSWQNDQNPANKCVKAGDLPQKKTKTPFKKGNQEKSRTGFHLTFSLCANGGAAPRHDASRFCAYVDQGVLKLKVVKNVWTKIKYLPTTFRMCCHHIKQKIKIWILKALFVYRLSLSFCLSFNKNAFNHAICDYLTWWQKQQQKTKIIYAAAQQKMCCILSTF